MLYIRYPFASELTEVKRLISLFICVQYQKRDLISTTCTPTKKAHIWHMCNAGQTFTEIANFLKMDRTVASRNYKKLAQQGLNPDFYTKPSKPGCPRALSAEQAINSGQCHDATDVQQKLFPHLHPSTLRRMFIWKGLHSRVRWQKPWLSKKHIANRRLWAVQFHKQQEFFWHKVWYSDESKFNLFGSDGKSYVGEE